MPKEKSSFFISRKKERVTFLSKTREQKKKKKTKKHRTPLTARTTEQEEPTSKNPPSEPIHPKPESDTSPVDTETLAKRIASISNKLSESNLDALLNELDELYKTYPKNETTATWIAQMLKSVTQQAFLLDSFVMIHTAFAMCAGALFGMDLVAHLVNQVVLRWHRLNQAESLESTSKEQGYLLVLLGFIYNFSGISKTLIFDIFDIMAQKISEAQFDFFIRTIRLVGLKLHKEDPASFKRATLAVHTSASATASASLKFKFALESLQEMTQTKFRKQSFFQIKEVPLFALCAQVLQRRGIPKWPALEPTVTDILDERPWWHAAQPTVAGGVPAVGGAIGAHIMALAKKHRMNTDVKRTIFALLMTSEDYMDAYERLLKLGLKEKLEREMARVIVQCAAQEKTFNPYYAHLSQKLCTWKHAFKITYQYTLWDFLKEDHPKRLPAVAHLYGYLVAHRCFTLLAIFKGIDRHHPPHRVFLKHVLERIQLEARTHAQSIDGVNELAEMLSQTAQ